MKGRLRFPWAATIIGAFLVAALVVAAVEPAMDTPKQATRAAEANTEGFVFEWASGTDDYAYLLEIDTGPKSACHIVTTRAGKFTHPQGLGSFSRTVLPNSTITGVTIRPDDAVHAGPLNSAHLTGPILGSASSYSGSSAAAVAAGESALVIVAAFRPYAAVNTLRVECDGPASLRFHLADDLAPISSSTATGGAGAESQHLPPGPGIGANAGDRYEIDTAGDRVLAYLFERGPAGTTGLGSHLSGQVGLSWPTGSDVVPLMGGDDGSFRLFRSWNGPGHYALELDRLSVDRDVLYGLLAGFVLADEVTHRLD